MPRKNSTPLKRYQAKRDFTKTPEPAGGARPAAMPRRPARKTPPKRPHQLIYCIHKHIASHAHYDLRLEHDGALLSWAVPKGPSLNPRDKRLAMRVEPHPLEYARFEGVIPGGYGAGVSMIWDTGAWEPQAPTTDVSAALHQGELKFTLHGAKLTGSFVLVRTGPPTPTGERERWLLIKHKDDAARTEDITQTMPRSAQSGKSLAEILQTNPEVWANRDPAEYDEARMRKVVEKIAALPEEQHLAGSAKRKAPTRPRPKSAKRLTAASRRHP